MGAWNILRLDATGNEKFELSSKRQDLTANDASLHTAVPRPGKKPVDTGTLAIRMRNSFGRPTA